MKAYKFFWILLDVLSFLLLCLSVVGIFDGASERSVIVLVVSALLLFLLSRFCRHLFAKEAKKAERRRIRKQIKQEGFEFAFDVVGSTLPNKDDDWKRQEILQYINEQLPPFAGDLRVTFEEYTIEDAQGIGVYINGHRVGDLPFNMMSEYRTMSEYLHQCTGVSVSKDGGKYRCHIAYRYWFKKPKVRITVS